VVRLRKNHPTFRRKRFFTGTSVRVPDGAEGDRLNDIVWLHPDGRPMDAGDWDGDARALGMYLNGHGIHGLGARGGRIIDAHFLLYFNAAGPTEATLPPDEYATGWNVVVDTGGTAEEDRFYEAGARLTLAERSVLVLREHSEPEVEPDLSVAASVAAQVQDA
jgi:glycogen operon protein